MIKRDYIDEITASLKIHSDDQLPDRRLIGRIIDNYRANQLKNEINKNGHIPEEVEQTIIYRVTPIDRSEVNFIKSRSYILKTVEELPKTLQCKYTDGIIRVRHPELLGEDYNYVLRDHIKYSSNRRFNKDEVYTFRKDNFMYVKLNPNNPKIKLLDYLAIDLILEEPSTNDMEEYPITPQLWSVIKPQVIQELLAISSIPEDKINNADDTSHPTT